MLNKKEFLKYASRLAFPIMIQNLIGTLVNMADTVMPVSYTHLTLPTILRV